MDTILPVLGLSTQSISPAIKNQAQAVVPSTPQATVASAETPTPQDLANQQVAALQQVAAAAPFNYPLGDKEFSIFKDAAGAYITRYVSLRDGSVTYVPAPSLVRMLQVSNGFSNVPAKVSTLA